MYIVVTVDNSNLMQTSLLQIAGGGGGGLHKDDRGSAGSTPMWLMLT